MQLKHIAIFFGALAAMLTVDVIAVPTEDSAAAVPTTDAEWGIGVSFTYAFDEEATE